MRVLRGIDADSFDLLSTDLFDTVLLRDLSTERERLDEAARRAAREIGTSPARLSALRIAMHGTAYAAAAMDGPTGDASHAAICRTVAAAIGGGAREAKIIREAEIETEIAHLSANRDLLADYAALRAAGKRLIATTDTMYGGTEIARMLAAVAEPHGISRIHTSSDNGATKHSGALFAIVAEAEGVEPCRILHVGDDANADVRQAEAAGWRAMHLPRSGWRRWGKAVRHAGRATFAGTRA